MTLGDPAPFSRSVPVLAKLPGTMTCSWTALIRSDATPIEMDDRYRRAGQALLTNPQRKMPVVGISMVSLPAALHMR